jgi:hypothetical protein
MARVLLSTACSWRNRLGGAMGGEAAGSVGNSFRSGCAAGSRCSSLVWHLPAV